MQERYYLCVVLLNSICMVRFVAGFITLTLGLLTVLKKNIKKSLQSVADYLDSASRSQRQQHWTSDDLKLPECKIIYNKLSTGLNTPVDYLLLGALVRTQQLIIESRIETDLARETEQWHNSQPPNIPPPIKTEHLRLQSPWTTKQNHKSTHNSDKSVRHKAV